MTQLANFQVATVEFSERVWEIMLSTWLVELTSLRRKVSLLP